jgi:hypothetical protein
MSTPVSQAENEARRRALERLETFLARADGGRLGGALGGAEFAAVLAELRALDAATQKRIARAMVASRGDASALRAALEGGEAQARQREGVSARSPAMPARSARPPTVVDARGETPWKAIAAAVLAVAVAAAVVAGAQ